MPYIPMNDRERLNGGEIPGTAGELNYAISRLVDDYLCSQLRLSYSHINEVVGALECAKLELYRRVAAPYEDAKMQESGDVYNIEIERGRGQERSF